jgi:hypothetical protein
MHIDDAKYLDLLILETEREARSYRVHRSSSTTWGFLLMKFMTNRFPTRCHFYREKDRIYGAYAKTTKMLHKHRIDDKVNELERKLYDFDLPLPLPLPL